MLAAWYAVILVPVVLAVRAWLDESAGPLVTWVGLMIISAIGD